MTCANCGTVNPADHRFCGNCGTPLSLTCPSCGAPAPLGQRFCGSCGTPLLAGVPALVEPVETVSPGRPVASPVAERRLCSVLFVDLVGFTTTSESRDPEEVRELLSHYFDRARTVVGRYGGTIEKFIGDAVMAVWGTPVATEQDAERAVRAALDLVGQVTQLGAETDLPELAARAGVVTGDVAVNLGATNQGMVAGDAVNTASRIQAAARPGTVFVDAATRRLTSSAIEYADEGEFTLKGKAEPEQLWRAAQVVASVGGSQRVDGLEAALIGRDSELRTIRDAFHASSDRSQSRLLVVTGPAGIGKSRLGWEFEKYVDGLAVGIYWHRGRCLSYGDGLVYWALAEVVRQRLQIAEDDPPEVAATRLAQGLDRWVSEPADRDFVGVRLGRLLGVRVPGDSGAALGREDLFAGWRRFFERLAAVEPVVIVLEDLHYAASDLLDFLDHLVDWARDLPIYVLALARPELVTDHPRFGSGRNRATITLDRLDAAEMTAIVDDLVPGMPAAAREAITSRAEGVPLYALESIRSLIDRGVIQASEGGYRLVGGAAAVSDLAVPDSLHALLAARLDALDPVARRAVGDASVLGATFPAEAVGAVSGLDDAETQRVLSELLRREVFTVSADPLSPQRGNYGFAQEMLRQVAYETLSRRDRRTRHLVVAQYLRRSFPNDGEEVTDAIARHYADALEAAPDDPDVPELRELLVTTLIRAAERSVRAGTPSRAADSYAEAAGQLMDADPTRAARLFLDGAAQALTASRLDHSHRLAEAAGELAATARDSRIAAVASVGVARVLQEHGRLSEARTILTDALEVLRTDPGADTLDAVEALGSIETFAGNAIARPLLAEAFDLANAVGVSNSRFSDLLRRQAVLYEFIGQHRLAEIYQREAIHYSEPGGPSLQLAAGYVGLANSHLLDDPAASIAASSKALEIALQIGAISMLETALVNIALAYFQLDDWDAAEAALTQHPAVEFITDRGPRLNSLAQLHALRGDVAAANADLAQLSADYLGTESVQDLTAVAFARAEIALAEGDTQEALAQALSVTQYLGTSLGFGWDDARFMWPLAARLADQTGQFDLEADLLAQYETQPKGAVAPLQIAEAEIIRARLAASRGEPEARARFEKAIEAMRRLSPPYHLAHGLLDYATFLRQIGDGSDVSQLADEALAIADRLRCQPLRVRAEALTSTSEAVG